MLLYETSSFRISHFGMKPVSGGKPPRDNKVIRRIITMEVDLFHSMDSEFILVVEKLLSVRNTVIVVKK